MRLIKKLGNIVATGILILPMGNLHADEGMWTFDNPPLEQWKEIYGFEPTTEWLEHVRLASVHIGASGGFVSPRGLLVTNQHVAADMVAKISTKEKDYTKDGFYSATHAQEIKSPDLEAKVLISYEDVTLRVQQAVKKGASDEAAAKQRKAAMAEIEKESTEKTGLKSKVVSIYNGGEYWLYRHKTYTDVRLVFAVEEQAAFFGGDYDNFTYPRYDLDVAFFRVYENGEPAKTPNFFRWSKTGPKESEFVLALGSPGSTARLYTIAQLKYQREFSNPIQKQIWTAMLGALETYSKRGPEELRQASSYMRGINNGLKRLDGQQKGLLNPRLFAKKEAEEKEMRAALSKNQGLAKSLGSAWGQIAAVQTLLQGKNKQLAYSNLSGLRLGNIASLLVRYVDQIKKPNNERYEEFRDSALDSLKLQLLSSAPIYPELEKVGLTAWLEESSKALGPKDPFIKAAIGDKKIADVVNKAVSETKVSSVDFRKAILEKGLSDDALTDPLIALALRVEPIIRSLRAWQEDKVLSVLSSAGEKIAKARFAIYGRSVSPDANSNLRISFGRVKGYAEDTTLVPYKTTYYGLFDRAESFDHVAPFDLPLRWKTAPQKLDLSVGLNFPYTADTIGGNSGSPVINRNGELVGINFDSNLQKLSNKYWFVDEEEGSRAVAVHSGGVIEALKKIYKADSLISELVGE